MALNYVSLVIAEQDAGNDVGTGNVTIAPTSTVVAAGQTVVSQVPVIRSLSSGTVTISLVATDNAGTTPAAGFWAYSIQLPGWTAPQTYLLKFSDGASQQFSNLTPAVASTTYGPAASSGGFSNPMTTLGDVIYENATPAAARLAGNTSNARQFLISQGSGGVAQAPAWGALLSGDLTGAALLAGATFTGYLAPAVSALTFGASIAVNAALGNVFTVTLTSSAGTIQNPSNPVDGQIIRFRIAQDATGGRTVAWGTAYDWGSTSGVANSAPVLSAGASKVDVVAVEYNAALAKWTSLGATFPQGF